jgi:transposase-like protein
MDSRAASKIERLMASVCENCPVCSTARKRKGGIAFRFVAVVEEGICPFCSAYEKVYGKKAHEP